MEHEERAPFVPVAKATAYDGSDLEAPPLSPVLSLRSPEAIALFSQYFAIGILYGLLPGLQFPIFNNYLHMEGYQTSAYGVLIHIGWSFKVFLGMLSDCVPVCGYRRKPWMLLGWTVATVCLALLTFTPFPEPFCDARRIRCGGPPTPSTLQFYNLNAPNDGTTTIVLSVLVGFGYVMANSAADAMVVEYAQREPLATRGRTQSAIYASRYVGQMLAQLSIAVLLNGSVYGGSFDFDVPPNVMYAICLAPCLLIIPSTVLCLVEVPSVAISIGDWVRTFWRLLQTRVMWQVCAFKFLNSAFASFGATPSTPIARAWAGVEPFNDAVTGVVGSCLMALIMAGVGTYGLHWNWRTVVAVTTVGIVAIDATAVFATVWDVLRNQWFYTGVVLAEKLPDGIRFMVASYCAVEISDVGNEGATYGLITTLGNLASPFAAVFYKLIDSTFDVSQAAIARDDVAVRWQVTYCFLLSYGVRLGGLLWLWLLPPQKEALLAMKRRGDRSRAAGATVVVVFFAALVLSVTTNFMSIYPATKCYRLAGGQGTVNGSCV
ncbi:transmembrane protein [Achlya hypogyna]|uniref:Transmembrane protein n=1 Tax=Achlya hypogyna TaxID=1202772 RepID=A0A1V9YC02_ACHHY|nr:transmembrane protein [Achlya hypogyna]